MVSVEKVYSEGMETALAAFGLGIGTALMWMLMKSIRNMNDGWLKRLLLYGEGRSAERGFWSHQAYQLGNVCGLVWSSCKQRGKGVLSGS